MNTKQVLFFHGGGEGAYSADERLVRSLQEALGKTYDVRYPALPHEAAPDLDWIQYIGQEVAGANDGVILVGHSLGGSLLLKYLCENTVTKPISGIFLISVPFWGGDDNWQYDAFTLPGDFATKLPKDTPIFLYQSKDDPVVAITHLSMYSAKLPQASVYEAPAGGHQFGEDLTRVAKDIKSLL